MHELSIAMSLMEIIEEECRKNQVKKVRKVKVVVGEMAGIVPDSLKFSFEVVSQDTVADGAELELEVRPVTALCQDCSEEFVVEEFRFRCPKCGSRNAKRLGGDELYIDYIETDD
ncbi:MAG: hydrogenase maturation nickel metallochaperone HypA [Firmicutes bacterium]|nr:hydrogenase maturation nickel metallochaperone HypA [Bacillota bacterium]